MTLAQKIQTLIEQTLTISSANIIPEMIDKELADEVAVG